MTVNYTVVVYHISNHAINFQCNIADKLLQSNVVAVNCCQRNWSDVAQTEKVSVCINIY